MISLQKQNWLFLDRLDEGKLLLKNTVKLGIGEIIITQTENQEHEESEAVQVPTSALLTKQAKLRG